MRFQDSEARAEIVPNEGTNMFNGGRRGAEDDDIWSVPAKGVIHIRSKIRVFANQFDRRVAGRQRDDSQPRHWILF